jgi:hypothetical protein
MKKKIALATAALAIAAVLPLLTTGNLRGASSRTDQTNQHVRRLGS